jgi:hypothetical protein
MVIRMRTTIAVCWLALGCKSEAPSNKPAPKVSPVASAEPGPPKNEKLVEHVKALAAKCTVNVEQAQVYACKDKVSEELKGYVSKEKPADFFSTLVQLATSADEKESAIAIAVIDEDYGYLTPAGVKPQATKWNVDKMLEAFNKTKGYRATRLATATTHLAMIANRADELYAAVDKHESATARARAYSHLMTYGRLNAFPKLKEVAKDKAYTAAALQAPRNMYNATEEEKAQYCPWAEGYLGDEDEKVATEAGYTMINCKGKYLDSLLAEANKRVAAGKYKNPFAMVMREPCFEFAGALTKKGATDAQCDAVYEFLEKTANDKTVDEETRGMALWNIYYQRRDKKTLDIMRKYENSPVKAISQRAKDAIKSLTETYKLK